MYNKHNKGCFATKGRNIMKKTIKKITAVILLAIITFSITACSNSGEKAKEIHIGYFNNVTHAQALLIKAEGTLEESLGDDVNVKWTAFNAGPAEQEALFAGDIDIGYIGPVPAITANSKSNGDVVILSSATKGGAVLVKREGSDIESVKDLAGKTVAIPQIGNTQHLCLLNLLAENGLKPTTEGGDVTISAVENADVANTMERGDIDAALVPEPWGATLLEKGAELVLDYDEVYLDGEYDVAVVVVRKEFMENNPELVEKFLEAHNSATETINNDLDNSLEIINKELDDATGKSLSESIIKEAFTRIGVSTEINKTSISDFARISKEQEFIDDIPTDEDLYANQ